MSRCVRVAFGLFFFALVNPVHAQAEKVAALGIIVRLKDEEPLNRWMAIQMAMRRWENVENFLVELLDDPVPMVRQAAHQALMKLSRGADLGPGGASPSAAQIRTAQTAWRGYLEMQDRPAFGAATER